MYSTDFDNFATQMLPPNYRLDKHEAWMRTQLAPMKWANDNFFEFYVLGDTMNEYKPLTTYAYQDRVKYNGAIYESQQDSNTGEDINDTDWWVLYNPNWVGVYERIAYNATKLVFEFALNKWFGGTFRQPPSTSDIYITNNAQNTQSFVVGLTEEDSSQVGIDISTGFVGNTTVYGTTTDFTINIPTALYPAGGDDEITQFADLIKTAGLTYDIVQY